MLWRKAYETKEYPGFEPDWNGIESLDGSSVKPPPIMIGIFSPDQIPGAELWVRLVRSQFGDEVTWALLLCGVPFESVAPAIKPSWMSRVLVGPRQGWPGDREFAWRPNLLMSGPPTEDAWELFCSGLASLKDGV